jgi:hypothetical protein
MADPGMGFAEQNAVRVDRLTGVPSHPVIPANAGTQATHLHERTCVVAFAAWAPAFAGVTADFPAG